MDDLLTGSTEKEKCEELVLEDPTEGYWFDYCVLDALHDGKHVDSWGDEYRYTVAQAHKFEKIFAFAFGAALVVTSIVAVVNQLV